MSQAFDRWGIAQLFERYCQNTRGNPAIKMEGQIDRTLCKLFWTALLLSADPKRAEMAVIESIESLETEDLESAAIVFCVIWITLRSGSDCRNSSSKVAEAASLLPCELVPVLHLPPAERHCFVLRILLTLDVQTCARLLDLDAEAVLKRTCAGVTLVAAVGDERRKVMHAEA